MTLCLGVRYLWIDSLCIVQDDAEDWAREAGQMAKVYRNAYLTLNAATSDADTEGFLRPRPIPDRVRLPPTSPSLSRRKREEHGFYLHLRPPQGRRWLDPEMDCLVGEPTSSRAADRGRLPVAESAPAARLVHSTEAGPGSGAVFSVLAGTRPL